MFESSNGGKECYYGSGWDPTVPLSQIDNLGASLMVSHGDLAIPSSKGLTATSQFLHYSSDASVFGGGAVNSYCLPGAAQNSGVFGLQTHHSGKEPQISGERSMIASSNAKRKRNSGGDMQRDSTGEISEMKELDEKKQKIEESGSSDQSNKQTKDNCSGEEDSKGYIHVRARRGQATNSHSLAERVRREKINDRMRLLQELVPGCNKITGKAVMLDEIINYVQSLQQQVEFLSMKLATVTPELNFDFEQILAKDNLHSRGILGFNSHHSAPGIHQEALPLISNTASLYHQGMWDGELHHMSFDLDPTTGNVGPNGR